MVQRSGDAERTVSTPWEDKSGWKCTSRLSVPEQACPASALCSFSCVYLAILVGNIFPFLEQSVNIFGHPQSFHQETEPLSIKTQQLSEMFCRRLLHGSHFCLDSLALQNSISVCVPQAAVLFINK